MQSFSNKNSTSNQQEFDTKPLQQMFQIAPGINVDKNALSWYTRDGRIPNKNLLTEEEDLFKEHLEFISKRGTIFIQDLESIEFKVSYYSISTNQTKDLNIPKQPMIKFSYLNGMPKQLGENIKNLKFDVMTPIQKVVIPYMQKRKDVVGISETGSGKTIAYLFPLIGNMLVKGTPINPFISSSKKNLAFPLSLILVPTRELAIQVYKEAKKMCYKTGINVVHVYGGIPADSQIAALAKGCDVLIATPGRLLDHINRGRISLKMISSFIIDEADRMLDMGFSDQMKKIVFNCEMPDKDKRQNLMFSATFDNEVRIIATQFLKDFFFVQPKQQAPKQIKQEIIKASDCDKQKILSDILKKINGSVIIFLDTKKGVDDLAYALNKTFKLVSIHGDRTQYQRQCAITSFTSGTSQILIATDVASRGLDFPNVQCVINYDMPRNLDDYIHRIGRTGRAGKKGKAISFINEKDRPIFGKLFMFLRSQKQEIPDWLKKENRMDGKFYGNSRKNWNNKGNDGWGMEDSWGVNKKDNWGEEKEDKGIYSSDSNCEDINRWCQRNNRSRSRSK